MNCQELELYVLNKKPINKETIKKMDEHVETCKSCFSLVKLKLTAHFLAPISNQAKFEINKKAAKKKLFKKIYG